MSDDVKPAGRELEVRDGSGRFVALYPTRDKETGEADWLVRFRSPVHDESDRRPRATTEFIDGEAHTYIKLSGEALVALIDLYEYMARRALSGFWVAVGCPKGEDEINQDP